MFYQELILKQVANSKIPLLDMLQKMLKFLSKEKYHLKLIKLLKVAIRL